MMFAVGRLNRVRSKIVVAGRLRESETGSQLSAGGPLPPSRNPVAGSNQLVQDGAGRPGVDRVRGGRDPVRKGTHPIRDHESGSRVH